MTTTPVTTTAWRQAELLLNAANHHHDPYNDVEVWVDFAHPDGTTIRRPAFWDGDTSWRVRFTSPGVSGEWTWTSSANVEAAGLRGVSGTVVAPTEYARYCRYLVARYGARPAVWLVGADGTGEEPQIAAGGVEVQEWDAYGQPTGIHYRPHAHNRAHQDADWLDFQWCQTGHLGDHVPERVADMTRNTPAKAIANGEPSYENTAVTGRAGGWWQGHEAWSNLCAGATMGVVYGAGSLWQWKLHPDEVGQSDFFSAPGAGWREALDFEGSTYVGLLGKILHGLPLPGAQPSWQQALTPRGLLVPDVFYLAYAHDGGELRILAGDPIPRPYRVVDPRTGQVVARGVRTEADDPVLDAGGAPRVFIFCNDFVGTAIE